MLALALRNVEKVVDEAIELADLGERGITARAIAERIHDSEPGLVAQVSREWIVERLTWMVSRRRRSRWNEKFAGRQMMLPDPIFQNLPRTIILRNGQRPRLDTCDAKQVIDHLAALRARYGKHPRITQMEAVLKLMKSHATAGKRITWGEVKALESSAREQA